MKHVQSLRRRAPSSRSVCRRLRRCVAAAGLAGVAAPVPALAHPGHSLTDAGVAHLLGSPDHLALLAGSGFALYLIGRLVRRPVPRRALQAAGVAALACAALLWGLAR
jgi:peptidoglycan/LPS O-acetylase OafA/YrhL